MMLMKSNFFYSIIQRSDINWGQIVALLYFGYRVGVYVLQRNWFSFFTNVTSYVIRFLSNEEISEWIANQGGWVNVLNKFIFGKKYINIFVCRELCFVWCQRE